METRADTNDRSALKLFTDASVNPKSKIGYGAYLCIPPEISWTESLKEQIKIKRFTQTSSTRLELQTLLWALAEVQSFEKKVMVYTDSQNIIGLYARRSKLEQNNYGSKKNKRIKNHKLYQAFFEITDQLDCTFIKIKGHKTSRQKNELDKLFTLVDRASRKALRNHKD